MVLDDSVSHSLHLVPTISTSAGSSAVYVVDCRVQTDQKTYILKTLVLDIKQKAELCKIQGFAEFSNTDVLIW